MSLKEEKMQPHDGGTNGRNSCTSINDENLDTSRISNVSTENDFSARFCRVCHCSESDIRGDAALSFLNIIPPSQEHPESNVDGASNDKVPRKCTVKLVDNNKMSQDDSEVFRSPDGEIFICSADVESGSHFYQGTLIDLGCSCKNDLARAHYACALKWFISHGSTICEICGSESKNVRVTDFRKVMASLKEYEELRNRTVTGELAYVNVGINSGIDPDAVAAIRRQRLSEISLWFNPQNNSATVSQQTAEELPYNPAEYVVVMETQTTKWALEGTGILVATGLLTIIITWFIAARVGKKAAKIGFHIFLGGICALAVLIFLRFVMLTKLKYGPARYWAILFVLWFLAFGIWASRTRNTRTT